MKRRYLTLIGLAAILAIVSQLSDRTTAQSQDIKAAYDRSASLGARTNGTNTFVLMDALLLNRIAVRGKMSPFGVPLVM